MLAEKIIKERKKNGWSQEELAQKMNVSRQAVSKWESAQAAPDIEKILQLSKLFSVTTDYLLKDELEDEEPTADTVHKSGGIEVESAVSGKKKNKVAEAVEALFWAVVLAGYLGWSFLSGDWHITWVVWPIAAALCAIISAVFKLSDAKDEDEEE